MIAGLAFQAFTMLIFILTSLEFARRVRARYRDEARRTLPETPGCAALRRSRWRRTFLGALGFSTACIFARCAYRVAELSGGWQGPLARSRVLFILLEGVLVLLASAAMVALHPAWTFGQAAREDEDVDLGDEVVESAGGTGCKPFDAGWLSAPRRWCWTKMRRWRGVWSRGKGRQSKDSEPVEGRAGREMDEGKQARTQVYMTGAGSGDGTGEMLMPASGGNAGEPIVVTQVQPVPEPVSGEV